MRRLGEINPESFRGAESGEGELEDVEIGKIVRFEAEDGAHKIWIDSAGSDAKVMVASVPLEAIDRLSKWETKLKDLDEENQVKAKVAINGAKAELGITELAANKAKNEIEEAKKANTAEENSQATQADNIVESSEEKLKRYFKELFEVFGEEEEELDFSKFIVTLPNGEKDVVVRKKDGGNVHVGQFLLSTFLNEIEIPDGDVEKQKLKNNLLAIEKNIETITRNEVSGNTTSERETEIVKELTLISTTLIQLMGTEDIQMPETATYVENGNNNSIAELHKGNKKENEEDPTGTTSELKFLEENKLTGRGNADFMRMHLNYAKLGGGNGPENWVVAPQWINKSPTIRAIEKSAFDFINESETNVIWYKASASFKAPDEKWNNLSEFPQTVHYQFGKYEIKEDGKTWEKKTAPIADSGSVSVPEPDVSSHETPRINMPSKTDYFTNNTKENRDSILSKLSRDDVDKLKLAREYSSYEELESKLKVIYPDSKLWMKKVIKSLKELESKQLLKW